MVEQYPHKLYIDQTVESYLDSNGNWQLSGVPYLPKIGDIYQGGIVFYIDSTGHHGLVCAEADQSAGIQWYNGSFILTGASGTDVGTGDENTEAILDHQGIGSYAAAICRLYNGGEYNDWFLPSFDELKLMYENLYCNGLGNFAEDAYWSSTEQDPVFIHSAITYYFASAPYNEGAGDYKDATNRVRAVRAF